MGKLFGAVKHAAKDFSEDECMVSGAALAYYTIFALPPLLVIVFFVAGLFGVSQQRINEIVKKQLGLPTSAVSGQQAGQDEPQSRAASESSLRTERTATISPDRSEPLASGRVPGGSSSSLTALTSLAASVVSADPQPQAPPLPEGPGVGDENSAASPVAAPQPERGPTNSASGEDPAQQAGSTTAAAAQPADLSAAEPPVPPSPPVGAERTQFAVNAAQGPSTPRSAAQQQRPEAGQGETRQQASSRSVNTQQQDKRQQQQQQQTSGGGTGTQQSGDGGLGSVASRAQSQESPLSGLGPVSKVIGIIVLIFSATGVFAQLQHALNRAWEVEPDPEQSGIWTFLFKRLLSLGMIAVLAFLLLVSLVLTTMVEEIVGLVTGGSMGTFAVVIGFILNALVTLAVATLLFAAMFKVLPDARMRWKDTWVGAFITAVLFVIGKTLLGWYLENSDIGSTWGSAAASMIAMLVWVYYTSLIVLFGAELAQVWANRYGAGIEPAKGAVRIVEEKRHVRGSTAYG